MTGGLTEREAYLAMFSFLERQYELGCKELGGILGSMSLLPDGTPADAALWEDWKGSVGAAKAGEVEAQLRLK